MVKGGSSSSRSDTGCRVPAPGSTCTVTLEMNRQGDLRLVADSEIRCYCNSLGGGAEVVDTASATFHIAAPARKTRRKAK